MINKNWARWIFASFTKHFESTRQNIDFFIEGDEREPGGTKDYFEFRLNGPDFWEQSKDTYEISVTINILIVHKLGQGNLHRLQELIGIACASFAKNVPMMKYGTGPDDDRLTLLGCMVLKNDREPLTVTQLGQVDPEVKEMQAMVQGTYCMYHEE